MSTDEATVAALMRTSSVITAVVVRSLMSVTPRITVVQARVLVIVWSAGTANVNAVADGLGVNASNASRTCDRLVKAGLLTREQADEDRRNVVLELSEAGQSLIDSVMHRRCAALEQLVSQLTPGQQTQLRRSLQALNAAAGTVDPPGMDNLIDSHLLSWLS